MLLQNRGESNEVTYAFVFCYVEKKLASTENEGGGVEKFQAKARWSR